MAMEALKNLVNHIPEWQKRLDDLSGQIDRRQAELAAVDVLQPRSASASSLRNKGSAESLKPQDDGPLHMDADNATPPPCEAQQRQDDAGATAPPSAAQALPSSPESAGGLVLHKKSRETVMAAHSRALAQAKKKKRRSGTVVSAEGVSPTYRTRSMIIVYYDSYVQGFFDELVRFISSSRNLLRKARMAAKVAQIKRMAELEMAQDDHGGGPDGIATESLPSLRYMSTRRLGPMCALRRSELGGLNGDDQPPDVYEGLDKSLEFVQSTCEHGAHQFLRDADCDDELKKIQAHMTEMLATAQKEIERAQREDAEPAKEPADLGRARARRPISVRREVPLSPKGDAEPEESLNHSKNAATEAANPVEVDPDEAADEGVDVMLPTLQYRSTRLMRSRAV